MSEKRNYFFSVFIFNLSAKLEKNIAAEIVNNEINVENDVTKKLAVILENHIGTIQKQKRIVTKSMQDNESAKHKYQVKSFTTKIHFIFIHFTVISSIRHISFHFLFLHLTQKRYMK